MFRRPSGRAAAAAAAAAAATAAAGAAVLTCSLVLAAVDPGKATAPRMEFTPPRPGTYTLEKIQAVADATLLDTEGRPTPLSALTTSKITLLTFFYTYCADPLGCPFAYHTLKDIRDRLLSDATLARQVRFVGISFDPTNDTPAAIKRYRDALAGEPSAGGLSAGGPSASGSSAGGSSFEWQVLTARSVRELLPVLEDFGQDVSVERAADGTASRTLHHMLKVFLIDGHGSVREIYTLAYLHPQVIVNDIRTLALEQHREAVAASRPERPRAR